MFRIQLIYLNLHSYTQRLQIPIKALIVRLFVIIF